MNAWVDVPVGWALDRTGALALSSFAAFVALLHSPVMRPGVRERLSQARARAAYWRARRRVPAYRAFLAEHGATDVRRFEDLPVMTKDNYIKRHRLEDLLQGGVMPRFGAVIDESSGSTGAPTNWVRGDVERASTARLIQFSARGQLGADSFVLLNTFALGPWATGLNVTMSMVDRCVVKSIGPDVAKVVATLELLGPRYRVVICGYPPFLKTLIDEAKIDLTAFDLTAIVGGEGMSEALRAHLLRGFRRVVSSFGASDLEINLALESDWSTAVRQRLAADPTLLKALSGRTDVLPMVFQYDPMQVYVENGPEDRLRFTLCRLQNISPRIRYDLADHGRVLRADHADAVLAAHGVTGLPPRTTGLPVLLHWGRQEHAVAWFGCKVTPEHVQSAVLQVPELAISDFALCVEEDVNADKRLSVVVELAPDAGPPGPDTERRLFDAIAQSNPDFRESRRMAPPHLAPRLVAEPFGASRLSGQDRRIKRRYVLTGSG